MRVLELWRYPIKSMQGERLEEVAVNGLGIVGDRSHALLDPATGLVLTARRDPPLLCAKGRRHDDGPVEVVLPDGRVAGGDDDLSDWLGRPVRLVSASAEDEPLYESDGPRTWTGPPGAFHDDGAVRVSLLGRGTIAACGDWDVRRFRPNIVLDEGDEDALIGRRVGVGSAILQVVQAVARCVMVTRPQPDGITRDLDVLRTILRERGGNLAVGAVVARPGVVRVGNEIEVLA